MNQADQAMTRQNELENMSDAELMAALDGALGTLETALSPAAAAAPAAAAPAAAAAQAPMMAPPTGMMEQVPPELVQQATARMVAMGLFTEAVSEITPEVLASMQVIIDAIDPGLYDLSQPEQLKEFIDGVNSGAIDLAIAANRARELSGAQPIPTGAGVPIGASAGFVPGGVFAPTGAGAAPAGAAPAGGFPTV